MTSHIYAWTTAFHGHLAVLGLALLAHPWVTLIRGAPIRPSTQRSTLLAVWLLAAPYLLGLWAYPTYRSSVKPELFQARPDLIHRFETKEHLAFLTLIFAVSAWGVLREADDDSTTRRLATALLSAALMSCLLTTGLGIWVRASAHLAF